MKFCPYFSQRLVNLLNLVHGKSEHWKQCVIPFSKQHKWNVLHFSQREPFCSAPLQELFSLVYMGQPPHIIRKSKFPQNPKRSVRFSGKRTKRSVQKRKARNTQKAETKVL